MLDSISYMIYYNDEYKVKYFKDPHTGQIPVLNYLEAIDNKDREKIFKYIEHLRVNRGILDEPYSRHITGKIRELRVDFARNRHRIFYFTFINKNIVMLHAFLKQTDKTPYSEVAIAELNLLKIINNSQNL